MMPAAKKQPKAVVDEDDPRHTPIGFAEICLGMRLYGWQDRVLTWFERAVKKRVEATVCTPNGAGKSGIIIAAIVLWWLSMHKRGKVVITTKDSKQLDNQIYPAIYKHRAKMHGWKFVERLIETPTGGRCVLFTTDEAGRAEGWHRDGEDEPLLMIVDEAKSVDEGIFEAIDRCTYDALLYTSSPGKMSGRFYDSHSKADFGFKAIKVGLADCPHIPQERIDGILRKYGPDHPFTKSTLYGEFMEAEGEACFDYAGVQRLKAMAAAEHGKAEIVQLVAPSGLSDIVDRNTEILLAVPGKEGYVWMRKRPQAGRAYIGFGDPMTGEQSEGSEKRDTHAFGIIGAPFMEDGKLCDAEVVAVIHQEDGCRFDNDIVSEYFSRLLRFYGDPMAIIEANNAGVEVLRLLKMAGRKLWLREKRDDQHAGKKMTVMGFQTSAATKSLWIGALATAIREQYLDCCYSPAVSQFATFVLNAKGGGEAQEGSFDDFVTGIGLGMFALPSASIYRAPVPPGWVGTRTAKAGGWG